MSILAYDLERLPVGRNYNLYAEPLVGIALPFDFDLPAPAANTNFNVWTLPASP